MGKSGLKPAPWGDMRFDEYIPSEMSVEAMRVGLEKIHEVKFLYPEELLQQAFSYMEFKMRRIWVSTPEDYLMSPEETLDTINYSKSPGYPYYYTYQDKGEAIESSWPVILDRVTKILEGEPVECKFTLTGKSELRQKDKVAQHKTRVFMASDLHHLIASKCLYEKQNIRLMDTIGQHPFDVGIQLPGAQYVTAVSKMSPAVDGDVSGNDLRFNLQVANRIRDLRHKFLPVRYQEAGYVLYNATFCGHAVLMGDVYPVYHQKSGGLNTASDNSIKTWASLVLASFALHPGLSPDEVADFRITSDDLLTRYHYGTFKGACEWLRGYNEIIESDNWTPRPVNECVYLSHHLEKRYVRGIGDFVLAAGNLPKLLASVNWIKGSQVLTFEESCIAHLLGLRICLFPWALEFERVDQILSSYLLNLTYRTEVMNQLLNARLDEFQLAMMHTGVEFSFSTPLPYQVVKCARSLIKKKHG